MSNDYVRMIRSPKLALKQTNNQQQQQQQQPTRLLKKLTNADFSSFKSMFHRESASADYHVIKPSRPKNLVDTTELNIDEDIDEDYNYQVKSSTKFERSLINHCNENKLPLSDDDDDDDNDDLDPIEKMRRMRRKLSKNNKAKKKMSDEEEENYDNEGHLLGGDGGDDESIESTLMEPYLIKFEEELLKSSKSDILRDLATDDNDNTKNNKNNSKQLKQNIKQQQQQQNAKNKTQKEQLNNTSTGGGGGGGHLIHKYLKEIKNNFTRGVNKAKSTTNQPDEHKKNPNNNNELDTENDIENNDDTRIDEVDYVTTKRSISSNRKEPYEYSNNNQHRHRHNKNEDDDEEHDDDDDDDEEVINVLELKKLTRHEIPWSSLEENSADLLISYLSDVESKKQSQQQQQTVVKMPDIFNKSSGKKIDAKLVRKWLKVLDNLIKLNRNDLLIAAADSTSSKRMMKNNNNNKKSTKEEEEIANKKPLMMGSIEYFSNKKRQILDKVTSSSRSKQSDFDHHHHHHNLEKAIMMRQSKLPKISDEDLQMDQEDDEMLESNNNNNTQKQQFLISSRKSSITSKLYAKPIKMSENGAMAMKKSKEKKFYDDDANNYSFNFDHKDPNEEKIYDYEEEEEVSLSTTTNRIFDKRHQQQQPKAMIQTKKKDRIHDDDLSSSCDLNERLIDGGGDDDDDDAQSQYINEEFVNRTLRKLKTSELKKKSHSDHFYNEINELLGQQQQNRNGRKEVATTKKAATANDDAARSSSTTTTTTMMVQSTKQIMMNNNNKKEAAQLNASTSSCAALNASENNVTSKNSSSLMTAKLSASSQLLSHSTISSSLLNNMLACDTISLHPSHSPFRRPPSSLLAKLKSPERKILYNEWFTIIKKMEKDPKFDLETLVRTRGRFTEHDRISYRNRLILKQQRLRCARSEPNFASMLSMSGGSGGGGETKSLGHARLASSHDVISESNRMNTTPAMRHHHHFGTTKQPVSSILNTTISSLNHHRNHLNESFNEPENEPNRMRTKAISSTLGKQSTTTTSNAPNRAINSNNLNTSINGVDSSNNTLKSALKLTLQKSDINFIKEILKKKDKNAISELTNMAFAANNAKAKALTKPRVKSPSCGRRLPPPSTFSQHFIHNSFAVFFFCLIIIF